MLADRSILYRECWHIAYSLFLSRPSARNVFKVRYTQNITNMKMTTHEHNKTKPYQNITYQKII